MKDILTPWLLTRTEQVASWQEQLTALPALGPENGGQGEAKKADLVCGWLRGMGLEPRCFHAPDSRVETGARPNIVAEIPGRLPKKLWLFSHLDVVPPGDLSCWQSDPWQVRRRGDLVFGRGVEDNQQAACSMLLLCQGLMELSLTPALGLGLVFMADEESGSARGLSWLLKNRPELFSPDDLYIVPDGGSPEADLVDVAEKAQLWLKFTCTGRQCHASTPQEGKNAFVAASNLVMKLMNRLSEFDRSDPLFCQPWSTFVPTLHEKNVEAINILPGKDVFFMDCRLLPGEDPETVLAAIRDISAEAAREAGVEINVEIVQFQKASATPPDCEALLRLAEAVQDIYGVRVRPVGIGGATVASFLRAKNYQAIVWSCIENSCHQPDEHSSLTATCKDAAVFGKIIMREEANDQI